jgi:hypothetical protein
MGVPTTEQYAAMLDAAASGVGRKRLGSGCAGCVSVPGGGSSGAAVLEAAGFDRVLEPGVADAV